MSCGCMKNAGNDMGKQHMHSHGGEENLPADDTKSALGILNERYARGEIAKEEYLSMKNEILSR
ncbi:SHOCT family protein [Candidatus Mancarchaeum acidiphilum]|uniref:SHOCT family protein n=2 Tax=Candidatus Mancarchaeum acidiphilum TaxID=1920749 RepID=A0A218NNW4_9ARCH|nr:SHOCT family protein [Candidatus Mancarchaeum acidiphilum]